MVASIYKTEIELKLLSLVEGALQSTPYRVVDLDGRLAGRSLLRLFVDRTDSTAVTIEDCIRISRLLEPVIENSLIFSGPFDLEVSTPGLDRRLRLSTDFTKVVGSELKLEFTEKIQDFGGSTRGILEAVEGNHIVVQSQGKIISIGLDKVKKAQSLFTEVKVI